MLNEKSLIKDNIKILRQINEWVGRDDVVNAIENSDIAYIYYAGDSTVNRGYRTIEPYALGIHKSTGNLVLRAWEQAGASDSKDHEPKAQPDPNQYGWRLFRLDGITTFMKTFKKFDPTKPRQKYNPNDKDMSQILASVSPNSVSPIKVSGTDSIETPDTIEKSKSVFDKQTGAFKSFTQNDELQRNKDISDLYGVIKFNRKQDPYKYIVVDKGGKLWYDKAENEGKYKPEEVLGNLNNLYREATGVKNTMQQTNKTFFQNQYNEFEKSLQN